jgi:disulfide bond formation protein DsbB
MYLKVCFLISSIATIGSLYLSEGLGLLPCKLCWLQRIFMYPLPLLIIIAMIYKDRMINKYIITISSIGGVIAFYHVAIQNINLHSSFCTFGKSDCSTVLLKVGGIFTIPMLSLIAFTLILICGLLIPKTDEVKEVALRHD